MTSRRADDIDRFCDEVGLRPAPAGVHFEGSPSLDAMVAVHAVTR